MNITDFHQSNFGARLEPLFVMLACNVKASTETNAISKGATTHLKV